MSLEFEIPKNSYKRLITTQDGKSSKILHQSICSVIYECGKCPFLDLPYQTQLIRKTQIVKRFLKKLGPLFSQASVKDCLDAPERFAYRHSVHLMISEQISLGKNNAKKRRINIGFYQSNTKNVIDIGRCPVQALQLNHISAWLRTGIRIHKVSIHSKSNPLGILDSVLITSTYENKQVFICFIVSKINSNELRALACDLSAKFSNIRGIFMRLREDVENKNIKLLTGHPNIKENLFGVIQEKSFQHFFAANPSMIEKILKRVIELQSIYKTKHSFSFVSKNKFLSHILKNEILQDCFKNGVSAICYISSLSQNCEKDFKLLENHGYFPLFVEPFDMLPGTDYVETVVLFIKNRGSDNE